MKAAYLRADIKPQGLDGVASVSRLASRTLLLLQPQLLGVGLIILAHLSRMLVRPQPAVCRGQILSQPGRDLVQLDGPGCQLIPAIHLPSDQGVGTRNCWDCPWWVAERHSDGSAMF